MCESIDMSSAPLARGVECCYRIYMYCLRSLTLMVEGGRSHLYVFATRDVGESADSFQKLTHNIAGAGADAIWRCLGGRLCAIISANTAIAQLFST